MKKSFVVVTVLFFISNTNAQNVGIGSASPSEKLDVAGNINMQGILKVNGNAGKPGQVLRVNNDGTQSWASMFGYKNRKQFTTTGITAWTVPAGVTEILIECVGGGGGGAYGGGGGAGAYITAVVKVASGSVININVGSFGAGATSPSTLAGFGGGSLASGADFYIFASGGSGATNNNSGIGGDGGANGDSLMYVISYSGNFGTPTTEEYSQLDATTYITSKKLGNGGACPYNPVVKSVGGFYSFNTATNVQYSRIHSYPLGGFSPGYGGAGNYDGFKWGVDGGPGLVAISW